MDSQINPSAPPKSVTIRQDEIHVTVSPYAATTLRANKLDESAPLLPSTRVAPLQGSEYYGYFVMFLSCFGFSAMTLLVRVAEERYHFSAMSCLYIRAVVHTVLSSLYITCFLNVRDLVFSLTRRQCMLIFIRGFLGASAIAAFYFSVQMLPVGDVTAIFFSSPVFTTLLCALLISERITAVESVCGAVSMLGVVLVARPGMGSNLISAEHRLLGSTYAFTAALLASCSFVAVRSLGTSVHYMPFVFSLALMSIAVSALMGGMCGVNDMLHNKEGTFVAFLSALCSFLGQTFLHHGLQRCRAGPGLLVRNLDVPFTYVLALIFFEEKPNLWSVVGSCLMLGTTGIIGWRQMLKK